MLRKLDIDVKMLKDSGLDQALRQLNLLKELTVSGLDFRGTSIGYFSCLATHPSLESLDLSIMQPFAHLVRKNEVLTQA